MEIRTPADVEQHLAALAGSLTAPTARECVVCYVDRMLDAFGCDTTLRWARRWRDVRVPGARSLERRLEARGGFCDCEVLTNGWELRADLLVRDEDGELTWPTARVPCPGVGPRSTQPCANWTPQRRNRW